MCLVSPRFLGLTCTADVLSTCLAAPLPLQGFTFWGFCALGGGGGWVLLGRGAQQLQRTGVIRLLSGTLWGHGVFQPGLRLVHS